MSESHIRFSNCLGRNFLLEDVERVMSERGTEKGSRRVRVQCCVQGCSKRVRKLRLHIRTFHAELCPWSCSDCKAKFVGPTDLDNHHRIGCPPRRKQIETFFQDVNFSNSSAVNIFITDHLQLDEASRNDISEVVDRLYDHLRQKIPEPLSINRLVKGGSVGKGTAVKDKADIDCVVFLNNVETMEEHKVNLQNTKDCLKSCLKRSPYKRQITFDERPTRFAVKFHFRLDLSSEFDIDLLPTFTTDQKLEKLYNEMIGCKAKKRGYYSAHFVSLQVEFVKGQPAIVKDLIRLVKYWRKTCIEDKSDGRLPSSYPLELITIHCWEKAGKPNPFDIRVGFKAVLQQLVDNCHINVRWCEYYSDALAKRGINGMTKSDKSRPFVLDPANPTNNVCSASDAEGWKTVADVAKMTLERLERQPLGDVIVTRDWQI